jgi:AcrR family transcriptional regulator
MGKLIDPERSRRAKEAREERAKRIFAAAKEVLVRDPYSEVTLDTIGQLAGVKQGQASFAFRSLEEVFMAVIRAELESWYDELETGLRADDSALDPAAAAELIAATLEARSDLTRLLGSLHVVLELHEDGIEVHRFYDWQRERLLGIADTLVERLPNSHRWDAFDALYRAQITAGAVHPLGRPVGNLAIDLVADDHQVFALDLADEVRRVVLAGLAV